ncbi:MAG: kelch repeat-containing protein [Pirellulales bacterium]
MAQSHGSRHQAEVTEAPGLPSPRGSHAGAMLEGQVIVVASGSAWSEDRTEKKWLTDTLLFQAGEWKAGPPLPHPAVEAAYATDGKRLYIVGGFVSADAPSSDVFALSLDNEHRLQIESLPAFPAKHVGGAAAVFDGRLYVAGGYADGQVTDRVWMLDLRKTDSKWLEQSRIPAEPRAYSALVAAGGKLYLLGGMTVDGDIMRVFKDVFLYDPGANIWKRYGELPTAGYCWAATPIDGDERTLLVGGRADGAIHDDLWLVNLSDLSVRGVGRSAITTTCAPLVRINPKTFWLIGGEPDANKTRTQRVTQIRLP